MGTRDWSAGQIKQGSFAIFYLRRRMRPLVVQLFCHSCLMAPRPLNQGFILPRWVARSRTPPILDDVWIVVPCVALLVHATLDVRKIDSFQVVYCLWSRVTKLGPQIPGTLIRYLTNVETCTCEQALSREVRTQVTHEF